MADEGEMQVRVGYQTGTREESSRVNVVQRLVDFKAIVVFGSESSEQHRDDDAIISRSSPDERVFDKRKITQFCRHNVNTEHLTLREHIGFLGGAVKPSRKVQFISPPGVRFGGWEADIYPEKSGCSIGIPEGNGTAISHPSMGCFHPYNDATIQVLHGGGEVGGIGHLIVRFLQIKGCHLAFAHVRIICSKFAIFFKHIVVDGVCGWIEEWGDASRGSVVESPVLARSLIKAVGIGNP